MESCKLSRSEQKRQKREGWVRSTFDHRNQLSFSLTMPGASLSHQVWRQAANGERRRRPKPFAESPNGVLLWFPRQNRRWQRPQWFRSQRILRLCVGPFGPLDQMRRLCITGFTFHGRHWCKRTLIKSGWGVPRCQSATVWVWTEKTETVLDFVSSVALVLQTFCFPPHPGSSGIAGSCRRAHVCDFCEALEAKDCTDGHSANNTSTGS